LFPLYGLLLAVQLQSPCRSIQVLAWNLFNRNYTLSDCFDLDSHNDACPLSPLQGRCYPKESLSPGVAPMLLQTLSHVVSLCFEVERDAAAPPLALARFLSAGAASSNPLCRDFISLGLARKIRFPWFSNRISQPGKMLSWAELTKPRHSLVFIAKIAF